MFVNICAESASHTLYTQTPTRSHIHTHTGENLYLCGQCNHNCFCLIRVCVFNELFIHIYRDAQIALQTLWLRIGIKLRSRSLHLEPLKSTLMQKLIHIAPDLLVHKNKEEEVS